MLLPKEVIKFILLVNWKESPFLFHISKDISAKQIRNCEGLELNSHCALQYGDLYIFPSPSQVFFQLSALSVLVLCQTALDQLALDTSGYHSGNSAEPGGAQASLPHYLLMVNILQVSSRTKILC